jgi:hypothetical protein
MDPFIKLSDVQKKPPDILSDLTVGLLKLRFIVCPTRDGFSYFRSAMGVDKYLGVGGCCCLLWPGRGGNAQKGQGKSLTKLVF